MRQTRPDIDSRPSPGWCIPRESREGLSFRKCALVDSTVCRDLQIEPKTFSVPPSPRHWIQDVFCSCHADSGRLLSDSISIVHGHIVITVLRIFVARAVLVLEIFIRAMPNNVAWISPTICHVTLVVFVRDSCYEMMRWLGNVGPSHAEIVRNNHPNTHCPTHWIQ